MDTLESINRLLLLKEGKDITNNVLAMLGLYKLDFPDGLQVMRDAERISVMSRPFSRECTCYKVGKNDPKIAKMPDGAMHILRCDLAMANKIATHPCLIGADEDDGSTVWTFTWPRDIEPNKSVIQSVFPELDSDALWENFKRSWKGVTNGMEPQPPSMHDRLNPGDGLDFDEDLTFGPVAEEAHTEEPTPMEEPVPDNETPNLPEEPAIPPKRGRGRPKGSTNAAKLAKHDIPSNLPAIPQTDSDGVVSIPACQKFGQVAADELGRLCEVAKDIITSDEFPVETIRGLKESLDRLALRAAHLELKGRHDSGDEDCLELWVETTLANIRQATNAAMRDLDLSPEKPTAWEKFGKDLKEVTDKAKCMNEIMVQPGMSAAIQEAARPVE